MRPYHWLTLPGGGTTGNRLFGLRFPSYIGACRAAEPFNASPDVDTQFSRRRFLASIPILTAGFALGGVSRLAGAGVSRLKHPTPRPGIDASRVVPASALTGHPKAMPVFDMVREIPQVIDGIQCYCGCAELPESYSLLSCYEGEGMARACQICQGEARLAHRLHTEGKSLDEIRDAIDERFA